MGVVGSQAKDSTFALMVQRTFQLVSILPRRMTSLRPHFAIFPVRPLVHFLPATGVLAVWIALMPLAGGFQPRDWYPAGLVLLGLLTVAVVGGGKLLPEGRWARVSLLAMIAFAALYELSVTWADAR